MNETAKSLIGLVNEIQDKLSPFGISDLSLELPQIAVIGGQSAGKSSILESFVGRDFLPRGHGIVTRRPLILQLIQNKDNFETFGEFLHLSTKKFKDFSKIRDEITTETDRVVKSKVGISREPINLKIYSPDVLDMTLIDLPGITKVPVGNQPNDIEILIENMVMEYIDKENCLILAVTAANQDLTTSDALKLAKQVDPKGIRTIGLLTKLDMMDNRTDVRNVLLGNYLPLKMGYIGVINRSQEDIEENRNMESALQKENEFFSKSRAYKDIKNRGMIYLRQYLNKVLTEHILKILPPLQDKFQSKLDELSKELNQIKYPIGDYEEILSDSNEQFRQSYESSIGMRSKGVKHELNKLSGGVKINHIMNSTFARKIDLMVYDENKIRREIVIAIQNFYGIYLGMATPDYAFEAVVENQIEEFRKPSIGCVECVSKELEIVIKENVSNIKSFTNLKKLFEKLTLDFVGECKEKCKAEVEEFVDTEKSYLNTVHEDFIGLTSVENPKSISDLQILVSTQTVREKDSKTVSKEDKLKSDWISYLKNDFWFELNEDTLCWYKNETKKERKDSVSLRGAKLEQLNDPFTLKLTLNKIINNSMKLTFGSEESLNKWKKWLQQSGVEYLGSQLNVSLEEEKAYADHMKGPVNQVKRSVDSYVLIEKKKFKDLIPRICFVKIIKPTLHFIAVKLRFQIRNSFSTVDELVKGDPEEEYRRDLTKKVTSYKEAIDIINGLTKYEFN